jgi:hypothetical protein
MRRSTGARPCRPAAAWTAPAAPPGRVCAPVATPPAAGATVADWWGLADKHRPSPVGSIAAMSRTRQAIGPQPGLFGKGCPRLAGVMPHSELVGSLRTVPPLAAMRGTEVSRATATAIAANTMRLLCTVAET